MSTQASAPTARDVVRQVAPKLIDLSEIAPGPLSHLGQQALQRFTVRNWISQRR